MINQDKNILFVIFNDTRPANHIRCTSVMGALEYFISQAGLYQIYYQTTGVPWKNDRTFLEAVGAAAAIIVNGEGSIHHDNERAAALAALGPACRHQFGVPAVVLNATFAGNTASTYAQLSEYDLVLVRDSASIAEAAEHGLHGVGLCPDFSMWHDFSPLRVERAFHPPAPGASASARPS